MATRRFPSLDGIRAVCAVFVLGAHAPRSPGFPDAWVQPMGYLTNGPLGVLAFFVLSGFLITYLLAAEERTRGRISLRDFYIRRCLRILPVYFAFVAAVACLDALTGLELDRCNYATSLTFTKDFGCASWVDGHLWSIGVEEQFYVLWPLLLVFSARRRLWYWAATLLLLAPVFRVCFYLGGASWLFNYSFMTNMDALMIGSMMGLLVCRAPTAAIRVFEARPAVGRLVCLLIIYAVWMLQAHGALAWFTVPLGTMLQAAAVAYLIGSYALVHRGWGFRVLNLRPVCYIGVLSYSIYIWQQPFFATPPTFGVGEAIALTFPLNIILIMAVAALSYHTLEKPLLGLRRHFRRSSESGAGGHGRRGTYRLKEKLKAGLVRAEETND